MSPPKPFLGILLVVGFLLGFVRSHQNQTQSAYEILESYNFPRGILPKGVKSYVLNEDGSFVVHFDGSCKFQIEAGYTLDYKSRIAGVLKYGSLKNLQGVSVKILFFWIGISEVDRGEGHLDSTLVPSLRPSSCQISMSPRNVVAALIATTSTVEATVRGR